MTVAKPRAFWAMLAVTSIAALVVLVIAVRGSTGAAMGVAVMFLLAAMITESVPAKLHDDVWLTLSVVVMLTAVPYLGLLGAVGAGLGAGVVAGIGATGSRLVKGTFNVAMFVLGTAAASTTYSLVLGTPMILGEPPADVPSPLAVTLGLVLAAAVFAVCNAVLMSVTVHLTAGVPWKPTLREFLGEVTVLQFVYVGISALAFTLLVKTGPISLVLLVVPLIVARNSLLSVQQKNDAYDRMVRAFVKAIELKDGYTRGHAERVSDLSVLVAERMGLSYQERQLIRYGAILHDVGKIGVSLGILCKAGPLDDDEFAEMKLHPEIGAEMLADIDFLKPALAIVHHHHERLDGRGYPAGLAGDEIPLLTRVVTAVDAFDAMTSTRSYRRALPIEVALEELQANAGTQFDPEVVEHLVAAVAENGWAVTDEPVAVAARNADGSVTPVLVPQP